MTFGNKMQLLRKQKGLSQEDLAEKLSVTRQTISKWELDQSTPDLPYIAHLSDLLGASTDYLIKPDCEMKHQTDSENIPNQKSDKPVIIQEKSIKYSNIPFVALSIVLTIIGCGGIITFIALSAANPHGTLNEWGYFEGLAGFLFGTNTLVYFLILCALVIIGIGMLIVLAVITNKKNKTLCSQNDDED